MPVEVGVVMVVEAIVSVPVAVVRPMPFVLLVDDTDGVPVENVIPIAVEVTMSPPAPPVVLIEPAGTVTAPALGGGTAGSALVVAARGGEEEVPGVLVT